MPFVRNAGARLYWKSDGRLDRPPLLLLNSIGTDMGSWDRVLPHLLPHARVLRMDARGHGASDAPEGDYSLDLLASDALAVMDAAGAEQAAICGVSLGGMVAMALALKAPARTKALIPACTSPRMDPEDWAIRIAAVRKGGTASIAAAAIGRFFSPAFSRANTELVDSVRSGLLAQSAAGYAGCCAAIRDMNLRELLSAINAPTLVIAGKHDASTPFEDHCRQIAERIPRAQASLIDAGHLAQFEAPAAFGAALVGFLRRLERGPTDAEAADHLLRVGMEVRREVLGDSWVDQSIAARTPFNADFQAMITRTAWSEIWSRPGLDRRTRRLLVIAITTALGRWEEFRLHVRAGLELGGLSEDELKETLMQTAIYAGVPAANTAFSEADRIVAAQHRAPGPAAT